MKRNAIILAIVISLIVFLGECGGGGGSSGGGGGAPEPAPGKIQNSIVENSTPYGLSTFAMGIVGKFPLEDSQTPEGIGYKTVAQVVRHIATNELYTFPETPNRQQVISTLQEFIKNGHLVTHEIHILSGPGMRKGRDTWINGVVGRSVYDEEFVSMLQSNQTVRAAVQQLFNEVVAYANVLEGIGVEVLICPELEDNENHNTFKILLNMLVAAGWTDATKTVRNGGFPGEFAGLRYEAHSLYDINSLRAGDILNGDGNTFYFSDQSNPNNGSYSEAQERSALATSEARGIIFFIWSAHLQGNQQVSPGNSIPYPAYTDRHYVLDNPIGMASILLGVQKSEVIVK